MNQIIKRAKPLPCNKRVATAFAKGIKTQTRRLYRDGRSFRYSLDDVLWIREPAQVIDYVESRIEMKVKYADNTTSIMSIPTRFLDDRGYIKARWIKELKGVPNGCVKEMARMFYRVKDIKMERLQDITIGDMLDEGVILNNTDELVDLDMIDLSKQADDDLSAVETTVKNSFAAMWNETAPKWKKWEDNPIVEVYLLEKIDTTKERAWI